MPAPPITVEAARREVASRVDPLPSEPVAIGIALDRVLAADVRAAADVPGFDNSAMDGFAVRAAASSGPLRIVGESRAGAPAAAALRDGEAIRISTGAALPAGADAVVRVEDTEERAGAVTVRGAVAPGQDVRRAGEDVRAGATVLRAGSRLGPAELALVAGAGVDAVPCARRPRVAILCTGDELRPPGASLGPGQIHDTNAVMLAALAARAGAEVVAAAGVPDEPAATERAFGEALEAADLVIASGGVSVGPHDHVKPALAALGVAERFWRVSLQPGKPTWFGTRGARLVLGLPGNPVSSFVTFHLFAALALRALQGAPPLPARETALLATDVRRHGREQALRVQLATDERGVQRARPSGAQGSHVTSTLVAADALAFVAPGEGALSAGTPVPVERI